VPLLARPICTAAMRTNAQQSMQNRLKSKLYPMGLSIKDVRSQGGVQCGQGGERTTALLDVKHLNKKATPEQQNLRFF